MTHLPSPPRRTAGAGVTHPLNTVFVEANRRMSNSSLWELRRVVQTLESY
jgi:hypothetical protein